MKAQLGNTKTPTVIRSTTAYALTVALIISLLPVTAIALPGLATTTPQVALAQPADVPVAFPRLAMWWPAPWSQPLEDIARYDWVGLNVEEAHYVAQLKNLSPDTLMLIATNSCEQSFSSMAGSSAQWLLTQVGSELTAWVDRSASTLPVAQTSGHFEVGDFVVIEEEIVRVTATNANSITVQRGVAPTTARTHDAGVRVAAAIQFWENSLVYDVTDACPAVDVGYGPETWIEANVRNAAAQMATADWDGLIIDRTDATQSWLIDGGWARSIDYDRSNTYPSDYETFDAAWNDGTAALMDGYRNELGDDVTLLPNGEMAYFDTVNGALFENFPTDRIGQWGKANWELSTFGTTGAGSLTEWESLGMAPNVSTVECYEDETDGSVTMPSPPDYQKMRFGLTTALVSGSYFSYEISTWAHGVGGLEWFDEYDNAGEGKGYLGQPIGDARPAVASVASQDLLGGDGSFDTAAEYGAWMLYASSGYTASKSLDGDAVRIDVTGSAGGDGVEFYHTVGIPEAAEYTLSFRAKASRNMNLKSWACEDSSPWTSWFWTDDIGVTTEWQTFEIPVTAQGMDPSAEFYLVTGGTTGTLWLDDVELSIADFTAYRRDFEGGIALVNPSTEPVTIDLDGAFRKIDGTQDRSVNDGSVVSEVTVPGRDGIVLLRETPADDPPAEDPPADDPSADDAIGRGPNGIDYESVAGPNRYATAVEVSKKAFPNGADTVVITTGQNWPDALSGGALAGTYDAPILLTESKVLPDTVAAEVRRLGATQAIILGGRAIVKPTVERALKAAGITLITRHSGWTRYQTAELIAEATIERLGDDWDGTALIATGENFPDALAGSSLASSAGWPLYLAEPGVSTGALADTMKADGVTRAILLGGATSVSSACEMALRDSGATVLRLAGDDRYETAARIVEFAVEHGVLDWGAPLISTGENFPDALVGGMLCSKEGSVLVLTSSRSVPEASANMLSSNKASIEEIVYLGGPGAVSEGVRSEIASVLE